MRAAVCNFPVLFIFEYIIWIAISSWTNDLFLSTSHGVQWSAEKELYVCNISSEVYYADKKHGMKRRAIIQLRIHARCQDNLIEPLKTKSQPRGKPLNNRRDCRWQVAQWPVIEGTDRRLKGTRQDSADVRARKYKACFSVDNHK